MNYSDRSSVRLAQLHSFERPRYFHGQMLDVRHFESEQDYVRGKLWLINRLVHGAGVVCGLDVVAAPGDGSSVVVKPGVALDTWGREIVVANDSQPIPVPPAEPLNQDEKNRQNCDDDRDWVHLAICYRECPTRPEPTLSAGCDAPPGCTYGGTRESYWIPELRPGKSKHKHPHRPPFQNPLQDGHLEYCTLAKWVTRHCQPCVEPDDDPCIVLANIRRPQPEAAVDDIDICVRPIVYGANLLFGMMLAMKIRG